MEDPNFNPKLRKKVEIIDILLAMIIIALSIISLLSYDALKEEISSTIVTYSTLGLFFSSFILELIPQVLNPFIAVIVAISSGLNVNFVIIIAILGSLFGSILGYKIGKKYHFIFVNPFFSKQSLSKILTFWKKYGNLFVFISTFTPIPYVPLVFGALGMSRRDFLLYGIIPRTICFILVGYGYYFGVF